MQQKRIGRGIQLTVAGTLFGVFVQALVTIVLLRLLSPADYAHYAMALLIAAFSTQAMVVVLERTAMLSRDEAALTGVGLPVGLLVMAGAGVALALLAALTGLGLVAVPMEVVATLLAANVVTGFAVIPRVLLRRRIRYGAIVGSEIAAQVAGTGLVSIVLAAAGFGALALVLGGLVAAAITLLAVGIAAGREAYWPVRLAGLRPLVAGARRVLETSIVETTIVQIPVMVVSLLGATTLGLFNRAMNLVQLPVQMVTAAVGRVFVSELVGAAADPARFREAARRMVVLTTATLLPICAGIAGAAETFTAVVMGPNWVGVAPALPYFAVSAAAMLVAQVCGTIIDASGQLWAKSRLLLVSAAMMVAAAVAALPLGLVGVAVALALANLAQVALLVGLVARQTQTELRQMLGWFVPGLVAGAISYVLALLVPTVLGAMGPVVFASQIVACALGATAYYLSCHRAMVDEVVGLLRS
jgi:PST family polysaccharide transporter